MPIDNTSDRRDDRSADYRRAGSKERLREADDSRRRGTTDYRGGQTRSSGQEYSGRGDRSSRDNGNGRSTRDRYDDDRYRSEVRKDKDDDSRNDSRGSRPPARPSAKQLSNTPPPSHKDGRDSERNTPGSAPRKTGTPIMSAHNPMVAELMRQGKLLASKAIDETSREPTALDSPPAAGSGEEGEALEMGELPSEVPRKRKHSPIVWNPNTKQARLTPESPPHLSMGTGASLLERAQMEAAALREMRAAGDYDSDIDPDAPPAMKASPSLSDHGAESEGEEYNGRNQSENGGYASDENGYPARPASRAMASRWLSVEEDDLNTHSKAAAAGNGAAAVQQPLAGTSTSPDRLDQPFSDADSDAEAEPAASGYTGLGAQDILSPQHPGERSYDMLKECRSVDMFERVEKISEGAYGVVYKGKEKATGRIVALKKVKLENEPNGFPITSVREINILLNFHHANIVHVEEVVTNTRGDQVFMVMEYMDHDLKSLMEDKKKFSQPFSLGQVKCLLQQLLEGLAFLHHHWVLHRDLKTSNILYNSKGELKLCDFGMARQYGEPLGKYTHVVVTLWYRAPELLFGAEQYDAAIDMWSVGCIMAELLTGKALLPGQGEFDQIDKMVQLLGTPSLEDWPKLKDLPNYKKINLKQLPSTLRQRFTAATGFGVGAILTDLGFDLLSRLLAWNPDKRITAAQALEHKWFREVPLPVNRVLMPTFAPRKAG